MLLVVLPLRGKMLQIESAAGRKGFQQNQHLVAVMGEFSSVLGGVVGVFARFLKCFHPFECGGDLIRVVDPVGSQGQCIGGKRGQDHGFGVIFHGLRSFRHLARMAVFQAEDVNEAAARRV